MKISLFPTLKNYKKEYFGKDLTAGGRFKPGTDPCLYRAWHEPACACGRNERCELLCFPDEAFR